MKIQKDGKSPSPPPRQRHGIAHHPPTTSMHGWTRWPTQPTSYKTNRSHNNAVVRLCIQMNEHQRWWLLAYVLALVVESLCSFQVWLVLSHVNIHNHPEHCQIRGEQKTNNNNNNNSVLKVFKAGHPTLLIWQAQVLITHWGWWYVNKLTIRLEGSWSFALSLSPHGMEWMYANMHREH